MDYELGHVVTKAAVIRKQLDQRRYILGNQTAALLESGVEQDGLPRWEMVNVIQTRSQREKEGEQNNTSVTNEGNQIEMEENVVEDLENLLSSFTREDEDTMDLVKIDTNEFI
ncbi:hypothetical protein NPIL_243201 [Nephila pilipes]|uniref:Uncharacterized protein n=1 Tax=Nephila pilipes TaxID=299642 RepID=A0A8X6PQP3_NEPPI|nr:hypothetical protein NPIL_243201 [Nephila pilipes]